MGIVVCIDDPLINRLAKLLFEHSSVCTIIHSSGSEGPNEDPYHYDEYTVVHRDKATKIHSGLDNFITIGTVCKEVKGWNIINERKVMSLTADDEYQSLADRFELLTGIRVRSLNKYEDRIHRPYASKCKCGSKRFKTMNGFPGEYIQVCLKCGIFVNHTFNESEII